jgi:hypothetical protein
MRRNACWIWLIVEAVEASGQAQLPRTTIARPSAAALKKLRHKDLRNLTRSSIEVNRASFCWNSHSS